MMLVPVSATRPEKFVEPGTTSALITPFKSQIDNVQIFISYLIHKYEITIAKPQRGDIVTAVLLIIDEILTLSPQTRPLHVCLSLTLTHVCTIE